MQLHRIAGILATAMVVVSARGPAWGDQRPIPQYTGETPMRVFGGDWLMQGFSWTNDGCNAATVLGLPGERCGSDRTRPVPISFSPDSNHG